MFCYVRALRPAVECWQALDAGVGRLVAALKRSGMYDNSIIIFSTDNGGVGNGASNLPLRGAKESLFEATAMAVVNEGRVASL